jgi:hypothetical protein
MKIHTIDRFCPVSEVRVLRSCHVERQKVGSRLCLEDNDIVVEGAVEKVHACVYIRLIRIHRTNQIIHPT